LFELLDLSVGFSSNLRLRLMLIMWYFLPVSQIFISPEFGSCMDSTPPSESSIPTTFQVSGSDMLNLDVIVENFVKYPFWEFFKMNISTFFSIGMEGRLFLNRLNGLRCDIPFSIAGI